MSARYQPFNDLPAARFEELKRDVEARGVVNPILVDEHDKTIDGHQRRRVAAELGIECPRIVIEGLSDDEKLSLAISLNTFRRHLSGTERMKALGEMARLGMSVRRISAATGIPKSTVQDAVSGVRSRTPESSDSPDPAKVPSPHTDVEPAEEGQGGPASPPAPAPRSGRVTGQDGKSYPATQPQARQLTDEEKFWNEVDAEMKRANKGLLTLNVERTVFVTPPERRDDLVIFCRALRQWADDVQTAVSTKPTLEAVPNAS